MSSGAWLGLGAGLVVRVGGQWEGLGAGAGAGLWVGLVVELRRLVALGATEAVGHAHALDEAAVAEVA